MIDETAGSRERSGALGESAGQTEATERVAFCQHCGRPLTAATVRRVGSAVYCEPCLVERLEGPGTAGGPGTTAGVGAGAYGTAPATPVPGEPSPGLAALLGLIPGVGAMYNGQFAKGIAHLVIFAILVSLADNVNGIFGLFVAGWVFYQAFEAYHTAKARLEGLPLPNAFGLNDIGERMGFGKNWPGGMGRPVSYGTPASEAERAAGPNWAGYVPPTNFGSGATPPPPVPPAEPAAYPGPVTGAYAGGPYGSGPYANTYPSGGGWQATAAGAPVPPPMPVVTMAPGRRFPVGAVWLIGLGLLFLVANLDSAWRLNGEWLLAIVLMAFAAWLVFRRVEMLRNAARVSGETDGWGTDAGRRLACQIRMPVMLLVLAVLLMLQAAHALTLGQTWPVLLLALGSLLLVERTVGRGAWYGPVGPAGTATQASYPGAGWRGSEGESRKDGQ